jgi:hypothetical protein
MSAGAAEVTNIYAEVMELYDLEAKRKYTT